MKKEAKWPLCSSGASYVIWMFYYKPSTGKPRRLEVLNGPKAKDSSTTVPEGCTVVLPFESYDPADPVIFEMSGQIEILYGVLARPYRGTASRKNMLWQSYAIICP